MSPFIVDVPAHRGLTLAEIFPHHNETLKSKDNNIVAIDKLCDANKGWKEKQRGDSDKNRKQ